MEKLKSRKLWITVAAVLVGAFYPPLIPLLKIVAPVYVGAEGVADAAGALRRSIDKVKG